MGTGVVQTRLFFRLSKESWRRKHRRESAADLDTELAAHFDTSVENVRRVRCRLEARDVSLHSSPGPDDGELIDRLRSNDAGPHQHCLHLEQLDLLHRALSALWPQLAERERVIVRRRLLADTPDSLRALGRELRISGERVRQLESGLIERLRRLVGCVGSFGSPSPGQPAPV